MYGIWYIVFGFLAIAIVCLVLYFVLKRNRDKFDSKYNVAKIKLYRLSCEDWNNQEKVKEYEETGAKLKEEESYYEKKYDRFENAVTPCGAISLCCAILAIILLVPSIIIPIEAKYEVVAFKHQKEFAETTIANGDEYENIAITQTIIEQNEWLAEAKADLEIYGCFSPYFNTGVEELQPITINRSDTKG